MGDAVILFDKELCSAVEDIVVGGGPFFRDLQWRLASLPINDGGLRLYSVVEAACFCGFQSSALSVARSYVERQLGMTMGRGGDGFCPPQTQTHPKFERR
ncbi:hypothetical protein L195_g051398 [Trifolium pratense]|uniref:Uncharacterized protein n=1 Tax=Trifolium pratense TaxID=57577 RepID=A0A2K3JZI7_TRIPR|nr:hypothetical protein L195_g051398 [Trifolium pratense]